MVNQLTDTARLQAEVERLRDVCGQAYQLAGAVGAPEQVLDVLSAAADGRELPHGGVFLPISADDCDEVRGLRDRLVRQIYRKYADEDDWLTADQARAAAEEVKRFDAPLGHMLEREVGQRLKVQDYMLNVSVWMQHRRDA